MNYLRAIAEACADEFKSGTLSVRDICEHTSYDFEEACAVVKGYFDDWEPTEGWEPSIGTFIPNSERL